MSDLADDELDFYTPRYFNEDGTFASEAGLGQARAEHSIHEAEARDHNTTFWKDGEYTRQLRKGPPSVDFKASSDINKKLLKLNTWKCERETLKRPGISLASADVSLANIINMIDTADRPAATSVEGIYAGTGAYAISPENKPGKRVPKAGAYAEAGVGRVRAELSMLEAEAKGPNASAVAEANVVSAGAIARAEVASASASAGPLGVKVGLGVDTGISVGVHGLEVKFLGIGFTAGPKTSISILGSEVSCSVM